LAKNSGKLVEFTLENKRIQKDSKNVFFEKKTKLGVQKVAVPKRRATSKGLAARAEILTVVRIIP
jgi:hypothetical protein